MSKALDPFGGRNPEHTSPPEEHVVSSGPDWEKRRERAVWYAVAGVGLMFAGTISTALGIGGAFMAIFGIAEYIRWTLRRPKDEDPWRDPDLDAWEEAHYGRGEGLDDPEEASAPDLGESNPDEAWGVHEKRF